MSLDDNLRNQIILGAVTMTGPVNDDEAAWGAQLSNNAKRLALQLNEHSNAAKAINSVVGPDVKRFVGTILDVRKEQSSTRAFLGIKTKESKFAPDGIETVRTERTDSGEDVRLFANRLVKELKGHRVLFFVEMQKSEAGDQKYRVLQHVEDLGEDPDWIDRLDEARAIVEKKVAKAA